MHLLGQTYDCKAPACYQVFILRHSAHVNAKCTPAIIGCFLFVSGGIDGSEDFPPAWRTGQYWPHVHPELAGAHLSCGR